MVHFYDKSSVNNSSAKATECQSDLGNISKQSESTRVSMHCSGALINMEISSNISAKCIKRTVIRVICWPTWAYCTNMHWWKMHSHMCSDSNWICLAMNAISEARTRGHSLVEYWTQLPSPIQLLGKVITAARPPHCSERQHRSPGFGSCIIESRLHHTTCGI